MTAADVEAPLTALPGVGPRRAETLARLGLVTVRDLLFLLPRRVERIGEARTIAAARAAPGERVRVAGTVGPPSFVARGRFGRRARSVLRATVSDDTGHIEARWFNQPWLADRLRGLAASGARVELLGRVAATPRGPVLQTPRLSDEPGRLAAPGSSEAVYPRVEGLGQAFLRGLVGAALERYGDCVPEPLPAGELAALGLPALGPALRELHGPTDEARTELARRRVALEPLLALHARATRARTRREAGPEGARGTRVAWSDELDRRLTAAVPFPWTAAQRRSIDEIRRDLTDGVPMRRLLQGDVGTGKTLVAAVACAAVAAGGGQSALLVPTELLATQHAIGLAPWLERLGVRVGCLTGGLPAARRRELAEALSTGELDLVVGTHALLAPDVRFARLDLAVIDEQQRFGVAAKSALLAKAPAVHALLMTATPIPRTLALALYGELDTSVLDEAPPGRGELATHVVGPERLADVERFLDRRLAEGERAFWIAPRIGEGEGVEDDADDASAPGAEAASERLAGGPLGRHGVVLLHGRLPYEERAARVVRFRSGDARLLVATSIVEVGVDVPEATGMVVDGAERFGLAQLHQLRGRVGRGARASTCFYVARAGARERLAILADTRDGFAIAEEDLRRRGMGELFGIRQSGSGLDGLEGPLADPALFARARELLRRHPQLVERYAAGRTVRLAPV